MQTATYKGQGELDTGSIWLSSLGGASDRTMAWKATESRSIFRNMLLVIVFCLPLIYWTPGWTELLQNSLNKNCWKNALLLYISIKKGFYGLFFFGIFVTQFIKVY